MPPKLFVATKAFIVFEGKVLLLRESNQYSDGTNAGHYDIVGGRLEPGQRFDDSLLREITEETGLTVTVTKPFYVSEWRPTVRGEAWQVVGIFFICTATSNTVTLSGDHDAYEWIDPKEAHTYTLVDSLPAAFTAYLSN